MIFFAIIITSVYDRCAEGASPVLISLLLISNKYSIWNLVFSRGGDLSHFFRLHREVFEWTARPHRGTIAAPPSPPPPKKNCPTNARGRRSWLKLTGLLKRGWVKRRRIKGRIRSTELKWPELNKWRQKFRPWQHSRSRGFKWFHWKWLLLVRNELSLIRKTLQRGESLIPSRPLHLWYTWFVTFFSKLKWGLHGKSGPRRVWMLHCVPAIKVLLVNLTFRFRCRYSFLAPWNWF